MDCNSRNCRDHGNRNDLTEPLKNKKLGGMAEQDKEAFEKAAIKQPLCFVILAAVSNFYSLSSITAITLQ